MSRACYKPCHNTCKILAWSVWLPTNHCCHLGKATDTTDIWYFPLASALEDLLFIMPISVLSIYRSFFADVIWIHIWLALWWSCCPKGHKLTSKTCVDSSERWRRVEKRYLSLKSVTNENRLQMWSWLLSLEIGNVFIISDSRSWSLRWVLQGCRGRTRSSQAIGGRRGK